MTATLTPAVQDLYARFAQLSPQEQQVFRDRVAGAAEAAEADIPESHWEILMERERLYAQGLDPAIPWEEAKRELRKKWGGT